VIAPLARASRGARPEAEVTQGPIHVLLVDDDDDNRDLLSEVLETAGFVVARAASVSEALAALAAGPVDVVLTDVGMPGMGGVELARAAKRLAPTVPVIAVTGWGERDDIAAARGREIDVVLLKPVDVSVLADTVGELVGRRPPRDTRR
jgi:CheY-like chemotaxis protein